MSRVVVHIDRLVLRGVDPSDAEAVARALQDALGQTLAPQGALDPLTALDRSARIRLGTMPHDGSPERLGADAGRRIARGMGS